LPRFVIFFLLPIVYIGWWTFALVTAVIPWLNVPILQLHLTLWQIIEVLAFFTLGIAGLIVAIIALFIYFTP